MLGAQGTRELEERALRGEGLSVGVLMDRAGRALAETAAAFGAPPRRRVLLVLGKGKNAGDALVAGRLLAKAGAQVRALALFPESDFSAEARKSRRAFRSLKLEAGPGGEALSWADLIVDAVLGTGARPGLAPVVAEAVDRVNAARKPVLAADLPTGVDADRGLIPGQPAIRAELTLSLGVPKRGFLQPGALDVCGKIRVADLGFPGDLLEGAGPPRWVLSPPDLPSRTPEMHKGRAGRVAVLGGSTALAGAAVLAARAAARSGAGLTYLLHPRATTSWTASRLLGEIPLPLGGPETEFLGPRELKPALDLISGMEALALGPGLGSDPGTAAFVEGLLSAAGEVPLVLDADGLRPFNGRLPSLRGRPGPTLLSPHPGEMGRLLGISAAEVQADRIGALERAVQASGTLVLLKGALTLIQAPGGPVYVNPTGDSGLAKGGSGDILTGLLAGLLAQGMDALAAALTGAFLHGRAGEIASAKGHPRSTTPEDLLAALGPAFRELDP